MNPDAPPLIFSILIVCPPGATQVKLHVALPVASVVPQVSVQPAGEKTVVTVSPTRGLPN